MNKLDATKMAVNFVVGAGVAKIVNSIIANNIQPEKAIEKITVVAGSVVLGSMAKDASKAYTNTKIDEFAASITELRTKIKEAQQEKK